MALVLLQRPFLFANTISIMIVINHCLCHLCGGSRTGEFQVPYHTEIAFVYSQPAIGMALVNQQLIRTSY
jgi:hypothetical protein